jgi:hypothetical protein
MKLVAIGAAIVGIFSGAALAQDVSPGAPIIESPQLGGTIDQPAISLPLIPTNEPAEDLNTVLQRIVTPRPQLRGTKTGPMPKGTVNVVAPGKLSVTRSADVLGPGQLSPPTRFERGGGAWSP